jgi:hypothetical protein
MGLLEITLIAVVVAVLLFIFKGYLKKLLPGGSAGGDKPEVEVEDIQPVNIIGKQKFKLVSYKEALEASREFIYSIARAVMQKFSPQAKETLLTLGNRLLKAGVEYIHIVDVFKISLDKQRLRSKEAGKEKDKGELQSK